MIRAGLATLTLALAGLAGGGPAPEPAPPAAAPTAAPAAHTRFTGCKQLRRWYVAATLPHVGPWGLDGPPRVLALGEGSMAGRPVRSPSAAGVGPGPTGTNVQEPAVDEADVAKTDGDLVVRLAGTTLVVDDVAGSRPHELSRTALPAGLVAPELVLRKGTAVVVGSVVPHVVRDVPGHRRPFLPGPSGPALTRVVTVDLGDPSAPRVSSSTTVPGVPLSTRAHPDGTVRVAVALGHADLRFVTPSPYRSQEEALRTNRSIVRRAPAGAWLPTTTSADGAASRPACTEVAHPRHLAGPGTLTVLTLGGGAPPRTSTLAASADLAYSSAERLYTVDARTTATGTVSSSDVHALALTPDGADYVASGVVPGSVVDRWSLDAYAGRLRVAVSTGDPWAPADNAVVVLEQRGDRLVRTGTLTGLGPGEQLRSVRWLGDLAVLVTFRATDPVHSVDLSDPAHPRALDELRLPGFSAYLHPVGAGLLLGVGQDTAADGRERGAQVSAFDVSDPTRVRRTDALGLGAGTGADVALDTRAFVYLPGSRTLVTSVQGTTGTRLVAVHVAADGTLARAGSWPVSASTGSDARVLPLDRGRVALVDDGVRVVDLGTVPPRS